MHRNDIGKNLFDSVLSLWRFWAIGLGTIFAVNVLGMFVNKLWLPLITLCLAIVLHTLIRAWDDARQSRCLRTIYTCIQILLWSAVVMVVINLLTHKTPYIDDISVTPVNRKIPFVTILVLSTVGTIISGFMLWRGRKSNFCKACIINRGPVAERGFLGRIFDQESDYQLWVLFAIMSVTAIGEWVYYSFFYINININSPDRFFFIITPTIIYFLSLLFLGIRYISLIAYYNRTLEGAPLHLGSSSVVRFWIICGDDLFLTLPKDDSGVERPGDGRVDTPAKIVLPHKENINDYEAENYFNGITGIQAQTIRFLYTNEGVDNTCNIFHFACVLNNPDEINQSYCPGVWMTMGRLQRFIDEGQVSPALIAEIERIYTITMTWKSYNRQGYRLYDIKKYKPSFRLRDFISWDVDYNDPTWLHVASNNQDKPFFTIKRLWRKYILGYTE